MVGRKNMLYPKAIVTKVIKVMIEGPVTYKTKFHLILIIKKELMKWTLIFKLMKIAMNPHPSQTNNPIKSLITKSTKLEKKNLKAMLINFKIQ